MLLCTVSLKYFPSTHLIPTSPEFAVMVTAWVLSGRNGRNSTCWHHHIAHCIACQWQHPTMVNMSEARPSCMPCSAAALLPTFAAASPAQPSQAVLLQRLFSDFPAPVLDMIAATPPSAFLEAAVLTRPARSMPTSLGRGGVAVLGEAAHPLRPTGGKSLVAQPGRKQCGAAVHGLLVDWCRIDTACSMCGTHAAQW